MEKKVISKAVLERLPIYLNYLQDLEDDVINISTATMARDLALGEVQVRKDIALVSDGGKPKVGYDRVSLIEDISEFLGCNTLVPAVIVGAGRLGSAILGYEGFKRYGVEILAAFSHHANNKVDLNNNRPILNLTEFESFCKEHSVKIGIITVPVAYAQEICDRMVACGIKAIWNFARKKLSVPSDVIVRQEDLAASVAILSCKLKNMEN